MREPGLVSMQDNASIYAAYAVYAIGGGKLSIEDSDFRYNQVTRTFRLYI